MGRKLLFIVFTDDACRRTHAFMYALELARRGHLVRILLEGPGTQCLRQREGRFAELFDEARGLGLFAGACRTATRGCKTESGQPPVDVDALAQQAGITLLDNLEGHAGIGYFVDEGFELVTF